MGKIRVYELAKQLDMANKDLVEKLNEMGYTVKSHSSTIDEYIANEVRDRLSGKKSEVVTERRVRPTVIRRRKKIVEVSPTDEEADQAEAAALEEESLEGKEEPLEPVSDAQVDAGTEVEEAPKVERIVKIKKTARGEEPARIVSLPDTRPQPEPEVEAEPVTRARVEVVAKPETAPGPGVEAESGEEKAKDDFAAEAARLHDIVPESQGELQVEGEVEGEMEVAAEQTELEAADTVEAAEGVEPETGPKPGPTRHKEPVKIKRIKKVTDEPARIISRPKVVLPPPRPEPAPPSRTAPPPPAPPRKGPAIKQVTEVQPPATEGRKGKKRKKAKESDGQGVEFGVRKGQRRKEIIEQAELYDSTGRERPSRGRKGSRGVKKSKKTEVTVPKAIKRRVKVVDAVTVADLAKKMGIKASDVIRKLLAMGLVAHINQAIDYDSAALVAAEFGYEVEKGAFDEQEFLEFVQRDDAERRSRPPVVTVMGHVDHGKTSLLDAIRRTHVIDGEAGGIIQHIGAYHVKVGSGMVTFLDTPGHEAFTSMRARGAQTTDIVVLIVAADDGVMQQTREAVDHAKAAKVPIIVAVNKVDKPEAEPDRIRREISDLGLVPESWGGDTIFVDVSAKTGQGVDEVLEMILLQAEMLDLKAVPDGRAKGRIIEARLDRGRGPVATVLIQEGRLKIGDPFVCGVYYGKLRAMFDENGGRLDEAGPSIPVEIQGIGGVPQAGDEFVVVEDEKKAKQVSQFRRLKQRESELLTTSKVTLETLYDSIQGGAKELNLVLKADVQGSLEAISEALHKLATDAIKISIIHSSTGAISETDIMLASASNALVIGFNVRPNAKVQDLAEHEKIQIRFYDIIYKLIDEVKEAMAGMLDPIKQEKVIGRAEVREAFHITKIGTIAGSSVTDGKIVRGSNARLLREDVVVYDGRISSLKRFKEDAREVLTGYECGIGLDNYNDIKSGDVIEAYIIEEVAATL